jgi:hypothetical protein
MQDNGNTDLLQTYMEGTSKLENTHTHLIVKSNLVKHLWAMNGLQ